jgi:hypothetical protein
MVKFFFDATNAYRTMQKGNGSPQQSTIDPLVRPIEDI